MNTTRSKLSLAAALFLATAGSLQAHRLWFVPSTSVLSGEDQWVTVDAAVSNDLFFPNHHPLRLDSVEVIGPDGQSVEKLNAAEGKLRSVFDLHLQQEGTYKIVMQRGGLFARWEENGEPKRWRGSEEEFLSGGYANKPGIEVNQAFSRVESVVSSGAPTFEALKPTGKGLELDPKTHPNDLFAGETARFVLLLRGKPAKGVEVSVVKGNDRYRDSVNEIKATTDENGAFEIEWPEPGRYWLNASTEGESGEFHGVPMQRSAHYTATFEVLPQ